MGGNVMKISFVLPKPTFGIMGGYKIVYEYANRFIEKGNEVSIFYDMNKCATRGKIPTILYLLLGKIVAYIEPSWFAVNKKITKKAVYEICDSTVKDSDVVIATAVTTAMKVAYLSENKGKKYYLIQDFENWIYDDDRVYDTYNYKGITNIVISKYLKHIVTEHSNNCVEYIPNGIDFEDLKIKVEPRKRAKLSIAFLYHSAELKGTQYTIKVLEILKKKYPDLEACCFGSCDNTEDLPKWISYKKNANRKDVLEILNNASIFICSTINEGFGLTGAESMACGCALATTSYPAVFEYAVDKKNCLVSPVKDIKKMAENVSYLIENDEARIRIAETAAKDIRKLDWDKSVNRMLELFSSN